MIDISDIREWRGQTVLDASGHKIGTMESVYVDVATDEPYFATVTVGVPTRHRLVFVPLEGAVVGPSYVKTAYAKGRVKRSPAIGTDDVLPVDDEQAIFSHYEMDYAQGAAGERRLARR